MKKKERFKKMVELCLLFTPDLGKDSGGLIGTGLTPAPQEYKTTYQSFLIPSNLSFTYVLNSVKNIKYVMNIAYKDNANLFVNDYDLGNIVKSYATVKTNISIISPSNNTVDLSLMQSFKGQYMNGGIITLSKGYYNIYKMKGYNAILRFRNGDDKKEVILSDDNPDIIYYLGSSAGEPTSLLQQGNLSIDGSKVINNLGINIVFDTVVVKNKQEISKELKEGQAYKVNDKSFVYYGPVYLGLYDSELDYSTGDTSFSLSFIGNTFINRFPFSIILGYDNKEYTMVPGSNTVNISLNTLYGILINGIWSEFTYTGDVTLVSQGPFIKTA